MALVPMCILVCRASAGSLEDVAYDCVMVVQATSSLKHHRLLQGTVFC